MVTYRMLCIEYNASIQKIQGKMLSHKNVVPSLFYALIVPCDVVMNVIVSVTLCL